MPRRIDHAHRPAGLRERAASVAPVRPEDCRTASPDPPRQVDEADQRHLRNLLLPFGAEEAERLSGRLLREFGSLGATLAAPPARRDRVLAGHEKAACHLAAVRGAMLHALREEALGGAEIAGVEALARYLRADMGYRPCEQLRVLFLDSAVRLVGDEVMMHGSLDSLSMPLRAIVLRALELAAAGIILVHNHPGGSPEPSPADIETTRDLADACRFLQIAVHDHLIVARGGWTSFRLKGLL